jgi:hypothetical protein
MPLRRNIRRLAFTALLGLLLGSSPAPADPALTYGVDVVVELAADRDRARVALTVVQDLPLLMRMRWRPDDERDVAADGELETQDGAYVWHVPAEGGRLAYEVPIRNRRNSKGYDAWIGEDWAIFRGDDLVPPARTVAETGAVSRTRLRFELPEDWSSITAYPRIDDDWYRVDRPDRRFDRPVGWMAAGRLGVRRAEIAGVDVAVAGPVDIGLRRMDTLAFLSWNLPGLTNVFESFPSQLLVLSAGEPMWRGGLSGPYSLFLHQDRPLISENATSTLMHELMHIAQGYRAAEGADWIVEGLAEFYSIEFMRRSGTLPAEQAERAFDRQERWGRDVDSLRTDRSKGPVTARAATLFAALDREIRRKSSGEASIDDIARGLTAHGGPVDLDVLRSVFESVVGAPSSVLEDDAVPGY